MALHSSTLAWKIPWMEEPGRLQPMGFQRVRHDWATSLSRIGEGNSNPLQCSCLKNPRDGGAWWAAVYGVTQSRTRLKWLSSSSSSRNHPVSIFLIKTCSESIPAYEWPTSYFPSSIVFNFYTGKKNSSIWMLSTSALSTLRTAAARISLIWTMWYG